MYLLISNHDLRLSSQGLVTTRPTGQSQYAKCKHISAHNCTKRSESHERYMTVLCSRWLNAKSPKSAWTDKIPPLRPTPPFSPSRQPVGSWQKKCIYTVKCQFASSPRAVRTCCALSCFDESFYVYATVIGLLEFFFNWINLWYL